MNWIQIMAALVLVGLVAWAFIRGAAKCSGESAFDPVQQGQRRLVQFPAWFAVVDVETTALDEKLGSLVSIGAVHPLTGETFYGECWVREGALIQSDAMDVNGADWIEDRTRRSEGALVLAFAHWMQKRGIRLIGGKNPTFDTRWLHAAWVRAELPGKCPITHRTIDLHSLAWAWALRHAPHKLTAEGIASDELYQLMGMRPEVKPHNALNGAQIEAEGFDFLILRGGVR